MIGKLAYTLILGKPLIMYGGIFTYFSLLVTASIPILNKKGIHVIPFSWHPWLAIITIILATAHAVFGLSAYFGF